jgi:hypothetical protein
VWREEEMRQRFQRFLFSTGSRKEEKMRTMMEKGFETNKKNKKSRRAGGHIKQKNNKRENKKGKKESRNKTECTLLARREEAIQLETGSEDWIYRRRRK